MYSCCNYRENNNKNNSPPPKSPFQRENKSKTKKCPKTQNMCKYLICRLHMLVLSIFMQQSSSCPTVAPEKKKKKKKRRKKKDEVFTASNLRTSRRSHVASLSSNEEQKKVGALCTHVFYAPALLTMLQIQPNCLTQNGSANSRVLRVSKVDF